MALLGSLWTVFLLIAPALAHGGHEAVPEGESISLDPIVCGTVPFVLPVVNIGPFFFRTQHYGLI